MPAYSNEFQQKQLPLIGKVLICAIYSCLLNSPESRLGYFMHCADDCHVQKRKHETYFFFFNFIYQKKHS